MRSRPEDRVQALVEPGTEFTRSLGRVKSPLLLPGDEIHPEVGPESVNMETTVSAGLRKKYSDLVENILSTLAINRLGQLFR